MKRICVSIYIAVSLFLYPLPGMAAVPLEQNDKTVMDIIFIAGDENEQLSEAMTYKEQPEPSGEQPQEQSENLSEMETEPYGDVMVDICPVVGVPDKYPDVSAHAAVLLDGVSGQIGYERQAHSLRPPASTTKIMTAILAIESGQMDSVVTISDKAASTGESTLNLERGQKVLLSELVEGALIRSGNDACVAIAEAVGGYEDFFVREMNRKATLLGAVNTRFMNSNGLPHAAHLSTAYDLALMARYGLKNPIFAQYVSESFGRFESINPKISVDIKNTNKLLDSYPSADGVKTGTTNAAGKCLVASATQEGRQLICVVLDAPDRFGDCRRLLEWGFKNTETISLGDKGDIIITQTVGETEVPFSLSADVNILVKPGEADKLTFATEFPDKLFSIGKGESGGSYVVFIGEKEVFRCNLLAENEVAEQKNTNGVIDKIKSLKQKILPKAN